MSREVIIQCPQCKSGEHKLIKIKKGFWFYECSCGKKFKAEFDEICISCDIIDNIAWEG